MLAGICTSQVLLLPIMTSEAQVPGAEDESRMPALVDLEELERRLVDAVTVAVAGREVVEHGALVRVGPRVPLNRDAVARRDLGEAAGGRGRLVADDVAASE